MTARLACLVLTLGAVGCATTPPPPTPADDVEVIGPISVDKNVIRKIVASSRRRLTTCYLKELRVTPGLHGKVVMEWDIVGQGVVERATLKEGFNPNIDACVVEAVSSLIFPVVMPENSVARVRYPFVFATAK